MPQSIKKSSTFSNTDTVKSHYQQIKEVILYGRHKYYADHFQSLLGRLPRMKFQITYCADTYVENRPITNSAPEDGPNCKKRSKEDNRIQ